jgi:hypothetical protein
VYRSVRRYSQPVHSGRHEVPCKVHIAWMHDCMHLSPGGARNEARRGIPGHPPCPVPSRDRTGHGTEGSTAAALTERGWGGFARVESLKPFAPNWAPAPTPCHHPLPHPLPTAIRYGNGCIAGAEGGAGGDAGGGSGRVSTYTGHWQNLHRGGKLCSRCCGSNTRENGAGGLRCGGLTFSGAVLHAGISDPKLV